MPHPGVGVFRIHRGQVSEDKASVHAYDAPFMAIAGLWREGTGNRPPAFTMLTMEPGPDVVPIHNRQIVVLRPENWRHWLDLSKPESELLGPLPEGSLDVQTVREGAA